MTKDKIVYGVWLIAVVGWLLLALWGINHLSLDTKLTILIGLLIVRIIQGNP